MVGRVCRLVVKLPPAFLFLAMYGVGCSAGRLPFRLAAAGSLRRHGGILMLFIAHNGIFYAGLRHWLFVVPWLRSARQRAPGICGDLLRSGVASSAIGRDRVDHRDRAAPTQNLGVSQRSRRRCLRTPGKGFDNESVDLGQRTPEPIAFYKSHIAPAPVMVGYMALRSS